MARATLADRIAYHPLGVLEHDTTIGTLTRTLGLLVMPASTAALLRLRRKQTAGSAVS